MRKLPRFVSKQIGRFVSAKKLFNISSPVFLPFYHVVSDIELPHILNYNYRNSVQFEKELDYFLHYFKPVTLDYLMENQDTKEKVFHLSFDDGLKECAEVIAPILLRKGIPATFFVNPGFVDNKALFHKYKASLILNELKRNKNKEAAKILEENNLAGEAILRVDKSKEVILDSVAERAGIDFETFLKKRKPYLTTEQILDLQNKGFSIGAHSYNHPEFWKISEQKQLAQIRESMHWINQVVQPDIKTFAFPFTDDGVSATVLETIQKENICDVTFGTAGLKYDSNDFHFQRYPVEIFGGFVPNLKSEWVYFQLRKWIGKATVNHLDG